MDYVNILSASLVALSLVCGAIAIAIDLRLRRRRRERAAELRRRAASAVVNDRADRQCAANAERARRRNRPGRRADEEYPPDVAPLPVLIHSEPGYEERAMPSYAGGGGSFGGGGSSASYDSGSSSSSSSSSDGGSSSSGGVD